MILLSARFVRALLPPRRADAHKHAFGHVLVAAGSRGMTGAGCLASAGALYAGAGLVSWAVPESVWPVAAASAPWACMTFPAPDKGSGRFQPSSSAPVVKHAASRRATAFAVGPGMSDASGVHGFVSNVLRGTKVPVVLDADALNACAGRFPPERNGPVVLTPHPGEASRLLGRPVGAADKARIEAASALAKQWRGVCVLKGRGTVVSDGRRAFVNPTGNPGMATAGTGDVLCGMIAGLIAQVSHSRFPAVLSAACVAAYWHGAAGDEAARRTGRTPLTAHALLDALPAAFVRIFGRNR